MSRALLAESEWVISGRCADAYAQAIRRAVRPDDVVIDLEAGVGVHAVEACRAGAARVCAVESDRELLELIPAIAKENGLDSRIEACSSVPGLVDARAAVVIASRLPAFGRMDGFAGQVAGARRALRGVDTRFVPGRLTLFCAPVEAEAWYGRHIERWSEPRFGLSFEAGRRIAANTVWDAGIERDALLAPPMPAGEIALDTCEPARFLRELRFTIERPGTVHAIAAWAEASLADGIAMSQLGVRRDGVDATPSVFPIDPPAAVLPGAVVEVSLRLDIGAQPLWTWRVRVTADGVEQADRQHSTFQGLLLDLEGAAKARPAFTPVLSTGGRTELDRLRRSS